MSLHLRVTPLRQDTQNSCWWTCMRMVLAYYGRSVSHDPSSFKPEFIRPWNRPRTGLGDSVIRSDGTAILAPYEWYTHGVPTTNAGLEMLCELTDFRPMSARPPFGHWTTDLVEEKLRAYGPYLFIGNWNREGFHAVLVVGRKLSNEGGSSLDEVLYVDPAMGLELSVSITHFNSQMTDAGLNPNNPLYYPTGRPIREVR